VRKTSWNCQLPGLTYFISGAVCSGVVTPGGSSMILRLRKCISAPSRLQRHRYPFFCVDLAYTVLLLCRLQKVLLHRQYKQHRMYSIHRDLYTGFQWTCFVRHGIVGHSFNPTDPKQLTMNIGYRGVSPFRLLRLTQSNSSI
jgi:hypothetical protein